jgi:hypothetical protein
MLGDLGHYVDIATERQWRCYTENKQRGSESGKDESFFNEVDNKFLTPCNQVILD